MQSHCILHEEGLYRSSIHPSHTHVESAHDHSLPPPLLFSPPSPLAKSHTKQGSTHGRIVEETYTLSGGSSTGVRPALPKGSLRITDAQGRLVCDLQDSTTTPSAPVVVEATAAAPAPTGGRRATVGERKEARSYWGKLVLHQVCAK